MKKIKTKNLKDLLDKYLARNLFKKYQKECGLGDDFEIQKIYRHLVLSPNTYALLYELLDNYTIRKFRINASSEETRERAFEIMNYLKSDFSGPKYFIPKIFFYDLDYNSVCYENIEGVLMIEKLKKMDLSKDIGLVAQWLRRLHSLKKPVFALPHHKIFFNFQALEKFYPELAVKGPNIVNDLNSKISP